MQRAADRQVNASGVDRPPIRFVISAALLQILAIAVPWIVRMREEPGANGKVVVVSCSFFGREPDEPPGFVWFAVPPPVVPTTTGDRYFETYMGEGIWFPAPGLWINTTDCAISEPAWPVGR